MGVSSGVDIFMGSFGNDMLYFLFAVVKSSIL